MFKQQFLSHKKEIQRWQADQGPWYLCKMEANLSTSLFPAIHVSTLVIHPETVRGISLCTLCPLSNPSEDETARTLSMPGLLRSVQPCLVPLWIPLSCLLNPRSTRHHEATGTMVSHHKNSPDSIF